MLNGFGDAGGDRSDPLELGASGARRFTTAPTCRDPAAIEAMIARCADELGSARHPRQQCRHPARLAGRELPARKMGRDHCAINLTAVFHTTRLALPAMRDERLGPDHQHRLGAQPRRLPQQVGLCRRQAWRRRLHQDRRAGGGAATASPSIASRPAMSGRPLVENQIPDTMKARGLTREQVMNDVLLAAQPTKRFVTAEEVAAWRSSCAATRPPRSPAPTSAWTAAGPPLELALLDARRSGRARCLLARSPLRCCIAACRLRADAPSSPPVTDWRAVATDHDRERLREWRAAFVDGARPARAAGPCAPRSPAKARCSSPTRRSAAGRSRTATTAAG